MSAPAPPPADAGNETRRTALAVGGLILLGALALLYGARVGTNRSESAAQDDPVAPYLNELKDLSREVHQYAPSLLGYSLRLPPPDMAPIAALERRVADLSRRASKEAVPLDTSRLKATLTRCRFERAMRVGNLDEAAALLKQIGGNEQHLLRVRLAWRRGKEPDPAWLEAWINSPDDDMAQAARVLLARRIGYEEPQRALEVLAVRVHPLLARPERARVALLKAVDRLEPHNVSSRLREAGGVLRFPRARARTVARAIELTNDPNASPADLIRALRVIGLLGGDVPPRGPELARAALGTARLLEARIRPDEAAGWRAKQLGELLRALGRAGLPPGPTPDGPILMDQLLLLHRRKLFPDGPYAQALLAAIRLDQPLEAEHLRAVGREAIEELKPSGEAEYLRMRVALARPHAEKRAQLQTELSRWLTGDGAQVLGPRQRARGVLEALPARPPRERERDAREAVRVLPESPFAHLALAEALTAPAARSEAKREAERAVEAVRKRIEARPALKPEQAVVLRRAARVLARAGEAERAGSLRQEADGGE